jgi:uncharacterized membrane protein
MIVLPRSRVLWRQLDRVSTGGWLLGLLFFALALTPSLIPRHFTTQGILCGCAFAAGYGIGVFLEWLWDYLELRWPSPRLARWIGRIVALACLILAIAFLWFSTGWQNSIRAVMGVAPVEARQPWFVAAIAVVPAAILIGLGTLLVQGVRLIAAWLARIIPRRVALAGAILVVGVLAATIGEGVVGRGLLYAADRFYGDFDRLAASQAPAPIDPLRSGSAASLIDWDTIGLDARIYVQSGPSVDQIADVTGRPAIEPLRVYVGLRSAETPEARAELALREMDRVGAFDRSILVLIMPVGTGWVEPAAIDIPISPAGCRWCQNRMWAWKRRARCSVPSMRAGPTCPKTQDRGSTCTDSAWAPIARRPHPRSTTFSPTRSTAPSGSGRRSPPPHG